MAASRLALLAAAAGSAAAVTQKEFDCTARALAYAQASKLLRGGPLEGGLRDVHDALQLTTACKAAFAAPPPSASSIRPKESVAPAALGTLHVATTGDDATADGSAAHPYGSLRAARDAARAKNDGPGGLTVGTIAVAAGRYELEAELTLGPPDNGVTFQGVCDEERCEKGVVLSGGSPLKLELTPLGAADIAAGVPPGAMKAQLPPGTGRLPSLYDDSSPADPRLGERNRL